MLILDFDFVERGIAAGLPERESWRAAFGLTVTIIWIYIEMLRILAILRGRLTRHPTSGASEDGSDFSGASTSASGLTATAPQQHPATPGAAVGAADLGAVDLGAGVLAGLRPPPCRSGSTALAAERLGRLLVRRDHAQGGQHRRQQTEARLE